MKGATTIYLGLGSNIDPARHLTLAVGELERRFGELGKSAVYRNAPVGFEGDDFLNMAVCLRSGRRPPELVRALDEIHALAGRRRGSPAVASRELDIDLLLYGRLVCRGPGRIELPRRDVLEYDFVLRPLAELAPDYVHPLSGRRLADHWAERAETAREMHREPLAFERCGGRARPAVTSRCSGRRPRR